jgi:hypothetical protein
MIQVLIFLGPAAVLVLLLLLLWRQSGTEGNIVKAEDSEEAQGGAAMVPPELPPPMLLERVFAAQDFEFVSTHAPREAQRVFVRERRAMALSWLRETRKQAARLMGHHLSAVRRDAGLNPATEGKIAVHFALFQMGHGLVWSLVWSLGPFRARKLVSYAFGRMDQLALLLEGLLAGVVPRDLAGVRAQWTNRA